MIKRLLRPASIILGIISLVLACAFFVHLNPSWAAANSGLITAADLQKAGFTQIKPLAPTKAGRFNGPDLYFQVSDKVATPSSEAPDVVMAEDFILPYQPSVGALYNYGSDNHDFIILGGSGQEATMSDGRVAVNFVKNYHYVVIIGPNKAKVGTLAALIAAKIK